MVYRNQCYLTVCISFIVLCCAENTDLQLTPEYAEAQVGARVQLNCTTYYKTEPVNWQHIPLGKTFPDDMYIRGNFRNNYITGYEAQTDSKTGIYSLIITKVSRGDGGLFRCIEKQGNGQHRDAELTVIDTVECHMFTSDSCGTSPANVTLECSMTFFGKFAPRVQWVTAEGDIVNQGVTVANQSDRVTSTLVIEVDNPSLLIEYTCQATTSTTSCKPTNSAHCLTEDFDSSTYTYEPVTSKSSTGNNQNDLWALLVIPIGIIIIIIIVVRVNKKCKDNKKQKSTDENPLQEKNTT